jgi:hypothetical protein
VQQTRETFPKKLKDSRYFQKPAERMRAEKKMDSRKQPGAVFGFTVEDSKHLAGCEHRDQQPF